MPERGLHTREAETADLDAMIAMRLRLQEHLCRCNPRMWQLTDSGAERRRTYEGWLAHPDACLLLLCDAELPQPIGMAVGTVNTHAGLGPERSGFIDDVWVEPTHRRRGGARILVRGLLELFEARGLDEVGLGWAVGNREAEALWTELGFRPLIVTATAKVQHVRQSLERG